MASKTVFFALLALLAVLWIGSDVVKVASEVQGKIARIEAKLNR